MQALVEAVGFVKADRKKPDDDDWGGTQSTITLSALMDESSLDGIETFSHVEVIFLFHGVTEDKIVTGARHPRNNPAWPKVGIFAQRGKNRPNRIGSTICKVVARNGRSLVVSELDAIDGTPVLDIKPVMTEFLPRQETKQPPWSSELMADYWRGPPLRENSMGNLIVTLCALAAVTLFHNCSHAQQTESKTVKVEQAQNAKAFREAVFSKRSTVTMVSHNGVYKGSDDDLELVLRSDGSVRITEYGFGVTSTNGKYVVNDDGTITVKPNGDPEWEPLRWTVEDELLVIRPPTKEALFAYARRAGVPEIELTDTAYTETYERWPLREFKARKESVTKRYRLRSAK